MLSLKVSTQSAVLFLRFTQSLVDSLALSVDFHNSEFDTLKVIESDKAVQVSIGVLLVLVNGVEPKPRLRGNRLQRANGAIWALERSLDQTWLGVVTDVDV